MKWQIATTFYAHLKVQKNNSQQNKTNQITVYFTFCLKKVALEFLVV